MVRHKGSIQWFAVLVLIIGLTGSSLVGPSAVLNAQPALLAMAAAQPDAQLGVIVQMTARDSGVEALVSRLGGRVTQDLHLIQAFAAEVSARDVPRLASAEGRRARTSSR